MESTGKKLICYTSRKASLLKKEMDSKLSSPSRNEKGSHISNKKGCTFKRRSLRKKYQIRNSTSGGKAIKTLQKVSSPNSADIQSSLLLLEMRRRTSGENCNGAAYAGQIRSVPKRRRRKRKKKNVVRDDAAHLQRRARYLLIRMKLEQNLIDAYSGDGWKGQSREKIKPEKELQRAEKQIVKCKHGIRDCIRQVDLLSSKGDIDSPVTYADESSSHEHVFCTKCKSHETFPDNEIILCDGNCNCGFHQKCLEPALEKIPPGDQGWLCKFCECRMRILETINAHLGTCFTVKNNWKEIFRDETTGPDIKSSHINPAEEWPSEDSEDEDYNPEQIQISDSRTGIDGNESEVSSSSSDFFCLSDEARSYSNGASYHINHKSKKRICFNDTMFGNNSVETSDCEITSFHRQRRDVDYKKLHDEMFGKNDSENEQSEDEDWGPHKRKRRRVEPELGIRMTDRGDEGGFSSMLQKEKVSCDRKPAFRIPADAVEKLRQVFAENELPSRIVRENLSDQLGIPSEKVTKWFRNARYTALKTRKDETNKQYRTNDSAKESAGKNPSEIASLDDSFMLPLSSIFRVHRRWHTHWRKNQTSMTSALRKRQRSAINALHTDKLQKLKASLPENQYPSIPVQKKLSNKLEIPSRQVKTRFSNAIRYNRGASGLRRKPLLKEMLSNRRKTSASPHKVPESEQRYLVEMERLCKLEDRLQELKVKLLACQNSDHPTTETLQQQPNVMYVPVVEVKEKAAYSSM